VSEEHSKGIVQTVLGPISPLKLGPTSSHEHLLLDFSLVFKPPTKAGELKKAYEPVTMSNLGWVCYDPFRNYDNLITIDEDVAIKEASLFKQAGGMSMIDTTSKGIKRDPQALARISRLTGLNIVMGSGYYIDMVHPSDMDQIPEAQIAQEIIEEISIGVGCTGIKPGIIGELGCSWPMTTNERKVLRAGAQAQRESGASITVHPGRDEAAPFEVLDILEEAGADLSRVIICHLDRTISDVKTLLDLAQRGCNLEYDFFGWEISNFSLSEKDMPNDGQRLDFIEVLIKAGYGERILIGQDMFGKHRQARFGGHGFAHIIENIIPRMRERGFSDSSIEKITIRNPARILTLE